MLLVVCSVVELHGCSVFDTISQLIGEQGTSRGGDGSSARWCWYRSPVQATFPNPGGHEEYML